MEEQAPPVPEEELGSAQGGSVVDVTLKRKTVHTNVTVVESATRYVHLHTIVVTYRY
jgi:hypothetical protein